VPLDPEWRKLVPDTPLAVTVADLARLAALATAPRPEPEIRIDHIRRNFISIQDAAAQVLGRLGGARDAAEFRTLVSGQRRGDAVVFFLALLELYKLGALDLDQPDHRGDLTVARRATDTDLSVLSDEYVSDVPEDEDDEAPAEESPAEESPPEDAPEETDR
jgi:segregation and condensation protein A